ncbi:hypothetical protein ACQQ9V_08835 [Hornefia butyriciproducens]
MKNISATDKNYTTNEKCFQLRLHFAPCAKQLLANCTEMLLEIGEISGENNLSMQRMQRLPCKGKLHNKIQQEKTGT